MSVASIKEVFCKSLSSIQPMQVAFLRTNSTEKVCLMLYKKRQVVGRRKDIDLME